MSWIPVAAVAAIALTALSALSALLVWRERKARRRFRILAEVAAVSDAGLPLSEGFEAICDILVPDFADFCMIDVIEEGAPQRAAVRVAPGGPGDVERRLADRLPSPPRWMLDEAGSAALEPRFQERVGEEELRDLAHDDSEDLEFLRGLRMRSTITVALKARGEVTGTLTLGLAWSGRRYRREDARFAWILSGRIALALDNFGLFADLENAERARSQIAETLQRGLLPPPLPRIPGWSIGAMYRPAGAEIEAGGDFYDVFRVPGGWMLAVGDVTGRGARAASITAVARYTLRAAAVLTDDPLVALSTLNRALLARGDAALCSLAAVTLGEDPEQPARIVVAGHPPPLLVDGGRVSEAAPSGPVLGAFPDAEWGIAHNDVAPGRQLVIATDGIAEARGAEGRFGEERLRAELRGAGNPSLALRRLEDSVHSFTEGALDDDVAILALSRESTSPGSGSRLPAVERLYDCFNRGDEAGAEAICDERVELFPEQEAWEELQVTPGELERRGETLLVRGRVYARSGALGIRDTPVAWIWELRDGRLARGEVFLDPERAVARFASVVA
jgi:ketosteroid isomerase-like protein